MKLYKEFLILITIFHSPTILPHNITLTTKVSWNLLLTSPTFSHSHTPTSYQSEVLSLVVIFVFSANGGEVVAAARGVLGCGSTSVSARATVAAVTAIISAVGTGPFAAIGVARSATVDIREAIGVTASAVVANVTNLVNCGDGDDGVGSVLTAAIASVGGIARVC
ncbi:Hypothetical predicted protein [Octopus vulgaris]|uniref:Uncharacterized protein n=1 Tax=Octopus vulgaris TaxID=6645 RepID=A0AA36BBY5_OCTVU|nr:Hypothetical predicted protein [Octopus vulgaris]